VTISSVPGDTDKVCLTYVGCNVWPQIYSTAGAALTLAWDKETVEAAMDMKDVTLYTLNPPHYDPSSQQSIQNGESCLVYRNTVLSIQTDQ
jgi:hypothetical protein